MTTDAGRHLTARARCWVGGLAGAGAMSALSAIAMGAPPAVPVAIGTASALVLAGGALADWTFGLCAFTAWLAVGDLLRKFTSNDLVLLGATELIAAAAIARCAWEWSRGRVATLRTPISLPLVAFAVWTLGRAMPGLVTHPLVALNGIHAWLAFTPLLYAGYALRHSRDGRGWVVVTLALGTVAALGGLLQIALGLDLLNPSETGGLPLKLLHSYTDTHSVPRPNSVFMHASRMAGVLIAALWLVPSGASLHRHSASWQRAVVVAVCLVVSALVLSGQRATLVCLLVGLVVMATVLAPHLLRARGHLRRHLVATTGTLVLVLTIAALSSSRVLEFYLDLLSPENIAKTLGQLRYPFDSMYAAVCTSLWGQGTGAASAGRAYALGVPWNDDAVLPLEGGIGVLLWEWGLVGPVLWVWLVWTIAAALWQRCRSAVDVAGAAVSAGALAATLTSMVVWFFFTAAAYQSYALQALLWLTIGGALASSERAGQADAPTPA